ncbi:hypothetical protein APSETT445_001668 [Aspergillus pseudonomiae]
MEQWVTAVKERIQSPIEIDIHDVFVADRRSAARPLVSAAGSYLGADFPFDTHVDFVNFEGDYGAAVFESYMSSGLQIGSIAE